MVRIGRGQHQGEHFHHFTIPSNFLDLPSTWLAHLIQHVATGTGGISSAAALSQTCKCFHALSESAAVTYRNLHLDKPLNSLDHPFFRWLAQRQSRVAGLTAELQLLTAGGPEPGIEQLQVMFGIPDLHLVLRCGGVISTPDDPFMTKVLRPHGHLIDHLIASVSIDSERLILQDFGKAAALCRRLELTGEQAAFSQEPLNLGALKPVAGSLVRLDLESTVSIPFRQLETVSSLSFCSQLTSLRLNMFSFGAEEPWVQLAQLTKLKQLSLSVAASGDPSPLLALTGLSSLDLLSSEPEVQGAPELGALLIPCTFSRLQPLSILQQLVELELHGKACSATFLHGLAELSRLKVLRLDARMLTSLEGVNTGLTSLTIRDARQLVDLAGIEHLKGLECLSMVRSGVISLHPLAALSSLGNLCIGGTFSSLAGLEGNLCTCLHSLSLHSCGQLRQLSGIEGLTALQKLVISACEVTSLQPVGQLLQGLARMYVLQCGMVQEEVLELPHMQPTADVCIELSNVREVVLAGGDRKRVNVLAAI